MKNGYLTGQLLLAMPNLHSNSFDKTVIYICSHDKKGAMGIIINQRLDTVKFNEILPQLKLGDLVIDKKILPKVHFGGPVDMTRGFILHSTDHVHKDTVVLNNEMAITATIEILKDIVAGEGPTDSFFALGYSGWGPGQLEAELQANSWLFTDASKDLIFNTSLEEKWEKSLAAIGASPASLSSITGSA